jgi:hypothetical protein
VKLGNPTLRKTHIAGFRLTADGRFSAIWSSNTWFVVDRSIRDANGNGVVVDTGAASVAAAERSIGRYLSTGVRQ